MQLLRKALEAHRSKEINVRKNIVGLLGLAALLVTFVPTPNAVAASPIPEQVLLSQHEAIIRDKLLDAGVKPSVVQALIKKWRNGIVWDNSNGTEPLRSSTEFRSGFEVTTSWFPDGSISVSKLEIPTKLGSGEIMPMSIKGCREGSGVGSFPFYDCRVSTDNFNWSLDFLADGMRSTIGRAQVSNLRDPGWFVGGATVSNHTLTVLRATQSGTYPAHGKLTVYWNAVLGAGSGTYRLNFYVRDMTRWDTNT